MNLCKYVKQIKVTGQKQENGAQIKSTSQSRSIYISLYLLLQIYFYVCVSFLEMINGCQHNFWFLDNAILPTNHSFWFGKCYAQALKKSTIPGPHQPIIESRRLCLCLIPFLPFTLHFISGSTFGSFYLMLAFGFPASNSLLNLIIWFRLTFQFQAAKICTP